MVNIRVSSRTSRTSRTWRPRDFYSGPFTSPWLRFVYDSVKPYKNEPIQWEWPHAHACKWVSRHVETSLIWRNSECIVGNMPKYKSDQGSLSLSSDEIDETESDVLMAFGTGITLDFISSYDGSPRSPNPESNPFRGGCLSLSVRQKEKKTKFPLNLTVNLHSCLNCFPTSTYSLHSQVLRFGSEKYGYNMHQNRHHRSFPLAS